jgi:nitroreductase
MVTRPALPKVDEILQDGDTVIVRWHGETDTKAGGTYKNQYCWVMRLQGGKFTEIISYLDTLAVAKLLREGAPNNRLDTDTTDRLLTTTRAIRRRFDFARPVEKEVLLECLRLSQQAPTASNAQSWRWILVTEDDTKQRVARCYRQGGRAHIERVLAHRHERDAQSNRMIDSAMFLYDNLERVPVLAFAILAGDIPPDATHAARSTFYASIYPSVWSFMLALRSRGLGSVLTTLHLNSEKEIGATLGIPENFTQMAMVPIGYIHGHAPKSATRPPVEDIVRWERWNA